MDFGNGAGAYSESVRGPAFSQESRVNMKARVFKLIFEEGSVHFVTLYLHKTLVELRRLGKYKGSHAAGGIQESLKDAEASCWQSETLPKDGELCEIHLAEDNLTVEFIAHESFHAAFHRRFFVGQKDFEEQVATDTGVITDKIVCILQGLKLKVKAG